MLGENMDREDFRVESCEPMVATYVRVSPSLFLSQGDCIHVPRLPPRRAFPDLWYRRDLVAIIPRRPSCIFLRSSSRENSIFPHNMYMHASSLLLSRGPCFLQDIVLT